MHISYYVESSVFTNVDFQLKILVIGCVKKYMVYHK